MLECIFYTCTICVKIQNGLCLFTHKNSTICKEHISCRKKNRPTCPPPTMFVNIYYVFDAVGSKGAKKKNLLGLRTTD